MTQPHHPLDAERLLHTWPASLQRQNLPQRLMEEREEKIEEGLVRWERIPLLSHLTLKERPRPSHSSFPPPKPASG